MASPKETRVRWYRRLDVRLTLMLLVALVLFDLFSGSLYDVVLRTLGLDVETDTLYIVNDDERRSPAIDGYAADLARVWLADGRGSAGHTPAEDDAAGPLAEMLAIQDEAFVVLDAGRRVVAASPGVPWSAGTAWPHELRSHTEVVHPDTGEPWAHAIYVPGDSGVAERTFALLVTDIRPGDGFVCPVTGFTREVDAEGRPWHVFLSEADHAAFEATQARTVHILYFVAVSLIAVLVAGVISWRLTRRLAQMSSIAARPLPCGRLPGPFDESGSDEVALLAGTMNSMRERVNQLLDDVARHEVTRREWLAQVSHDLRTPLTALVACLDRAELAIQSPRPETLYQEVPDLLAVAKLDVDRVESLANDLFEIARLEARDALNLEPVPPGELVRQAVKGLEPLAAKKGVRLQVQLPTRLPILSADGRRLMRALENLLRNAIQHAVAYVWVRVERNTDGLRFEVRDDGAGFPEQEGELSLDELRSRRSREDSAGLGLLVTQRVAEAHGGTVGAHNSQSGGAVVWFALPDRPDDDDATDETEEQAGEREVGLAS